MKKKNLAQHTVLVALIAAAYVCLTLLSSAFGLAYAGLQFRISEALNVFAALSPTAVYGLTLGCLLSNISSPFGPLDIILGSLATFLSAILIRLIAKRNFKCKALLFSLPPAILNGLVVAVESIIFAVEGASATLFLITFVQVFLSEMIVIIIMGAPLYKFAQKHFKF